MSWRDSARCKDLEYTEADRLFFPDNMSGRHVAAGKQFCSKCPVSLECGIMGLLAGDGIFGGMTPAERKKAKDNA